MSEINVKAGTASVTYDAIVVGSGISGGWAAKELTERGLKTLVLERGRDVKHIKDYPTANLERWQIPNRGQVPQAEIAKHYFKQNRTGYTIREEYKHWWVKDDEHPYTEKQRFDWMRGYHVGGRSLMWGRQSYRLSPMDFEANLKDGIGVDWPVRYEDIAPWYSHVEKFIGVSGRKEGLPQLPDGEFLPPMELNCLEQHARDIIGKKFPGRVLTIGRAAHLTVPHNGRGKCQYRDRCMRGCPFGGYFSSNASTLPAAERTGNMTLRPHSLVHEIIFDPTTQKAHGVRVLDTETKQTLEFYARIIFLCAGALNSTWLMLLSKSDRFPNGFGNDSGELGHNLMDHHFQVGAEGTYEGLEDKFYYGRRPNGIYVPRFRNIDKASKRGYLRGFGYQGGAGRDGWYRLVKELDFGTSFKSKLSQPGPWSMGLLGFGECLPYHDNSISINYDVRDIHGMPTLTIDASFKDNEFNMRKDMANDAAEMLEAVGLKNVKTYDNNAYPGLGIHEMGTARMGRDPKTSVLNGFNQVHACKNVFVTDGSFMTSSGCQNPSLTYMAFTARAANYAADALKKGEL